MQRPTTRYRLLVSLLSPLLVGYTLWRSYKDGGKRYLLERFGFYSQPKNRQAPCWIHAASVGEVLTVLPLVKALPDTLSILLTTNTPTAYEVLEKQPLSNVHHAYLPLDFGRTTRRFIRSFKPRSAWMVETEIWPWLYARCFEVGIEITIINGRLSQRTRLQANGFLASSYQRALMNVQVLARSDDDGQAFQTLGARADNITTAGNLKYAYSGKEPQTRRLLSRPYVVAASTHADEEIRLATQWIARDNDAVLVIVPRHPERGETIRKQLESAIIPCVTRSSDSTLASDQRIYIADTLGELVHWFAFAKGVFVGGSLIERGGHNVLEPARYACPIVVGKHTQNFSDIIEPLIAAEGIEVVSDEQQVVHFLDSTVSDTEDLVAMGQRAQVFAEDKERVLDGYLKLLS